MQRFRDVAKVRNPRCASRENSPRQRLDGVGSVPDVGGRGFLPGDDGGARIAPLAQMQAVTASWTLSTRSPLVKRGTSFAHERPANPIPKAICALSLGKSPATLNAWLAKLS
jgi:hypothetical protein